MTGAMVNHDDRLMRANSGIARDWLSVHAWSARRRAMVAATIATAAALGAGTACVEADLAGERAARTALASAQRTLADAQRAAARLPALRQSVSLAPRSVGEGSAAEDVRRVSKLTSTVGLTLVTLEPAAQDGTGTQRFRPMKLVAQGSFAQLRAFLAGLSAEPGLVVPEDLVIKRDGDGLSIAATLQVFDGLPPLQPLPLDGRRDALVAQTSDPFTSDAADGAGGGALRLAGVIHDRAAIVALVETASGTQAVRTGQAFEGGRITGVLSSGVVFATGGRSQTLTWSQEAK